MPLRIIFMGTPEFSVPTLAALAADGHRIVAAYSQPPRPGGRRGLDLQKSPVHRAADLLGIPVYTPVNFKAENDRQSFIDLDADVAVVVAYGLLLPEAILNGTRLGCYNGHASLLPRWRGAAPLQRAIMAGDRETGMMVMKMDKGLDTGPVALTERVAIPETMTAGELHDRMMQTGGKLMSKAMKLLDEGSLPLTPQAGDGIVYASKIDKGETRIDFSRAAADVHNHIRGLSPVPGAWFEAEFSGRMERVKVLQSEKADGGGDAGIVLDSQLTIACGSGAVRLLRLQKAGGKPLDAAEFLRGFSDPCRNQVVLMPRFRMTIEYDGSAFVGWQRQENGHSVQGAIESAVLKFTGETVSVRGAGRTDSGVHARGQVAHVDLTKDWPAETVRNALNAYLGRARDRISILDAVQVPESFDARFSATRRHYVYRIIQRPSPLALEARQAWWVAKPLDHEAMHAAAQTLIGRHDFTTFRATHCQANSPIRTLDRLDVTRDGDRIEIHATAQSFLHNQIRSFAGTLKLVGDGRWTPEDVRAALDAKDRTACGPVAPPDGLYFMRVDY